MIREPRTSRCTSWIQRDRGTRNQTANICWIIQKAKEFHKNIFFCFIDYPKAFHCVDHKEMWKILKQIYTRPPEKPVLGQEATVRTEHRTDWSQTGKGVEQDCILSSCLFNLYAEYCSPPGSSVLWIVQARIPEWVTISFSRGFSWPRNQAWVSRTAGRFFAVWATREALYPEFIMQNARLDEAQVGIKIIGRNINNLRYADDTTLMVESEEEMKSLLMKVKEKSEWR